jgi:hypothetical protein
MTKNHTTPTTVLLTVAVLAAVLVVTCTISAAVSQPAAASISREKNGGPGEKNGGSGEKNGGSGEKNGGSPSDPGISVTTNTNQLQNCQTAGGTSPITGSCIGTSTNTITESGGVIGAPR